MKEKDIFIKNRWDVIEKSLFRRNRERGEAESGCGVNCSCMLCRYREDWGLDDPTGKADEDFLAVMRSIEEKIRDLKRRIQAGEIVF